MSWALNNVPNDAVGIIGLGHMGAPMAARLLASGRQVYGVDTNASVRESAAASGVTVVASATDLAKTVETIILMLPNSDIVDSIAGYLTAGDRASRRCRFVIDMSSSEPRRTQQLSERLSKDGVELIDAPVSGGVPGAIAGNLTIMVGGTEEQYERIVPLLSVLGSRIVHVGAVGAGHATKALNNLLSATHLLATNEAAIVASRFGIDPHVLLSVVNTSSGRSGSSEVKLPRYVLTGDFNSGFSATLLEKDVKIAAALAADLGIETVIGDAVARRWSELNAELPASADHTEIIKPLERRAGLEVRSRSSRPS
ncbi:NAD(P)-dependent oxidoreductase [Lysinimonas soli]|uniref:NAD(P)-dependent oxidoreductase n=1 Tax=Lysinimonas soli TaxID=1074233 RepID=A0ABW0NPI2_9MICO